MRSALKFIAGAIVAGVLWQWGTPLYDAAICRVVTPLLHVDSRLSGTVAERNGANVRVRRTDDLAFQNVEIPASELTYNVILLGGLLAIRRGRPKAVAIALACFVLTHVLAFVVSIELMYATRIPKWSDLHYSAHEQDFWTAAEYGYRLAGMFGIAFGAWWLSLPDDSLTPPETAPRAKRPRSQRA